MKYLGLVRIQLESVLHIPLLDIGGTCSENGQAQAISTTDSFKNKLNKFWSNQDLIYNYKAELTG